MTDLTAALTERLEREATGMAAAEEGTAARGRRRPTLHLTSSNVPARPCVTSFHARSQHVTDLVVLPSWRVTFPAVLMVSWK